MTWRHVIGAGMLGGIGFTMSLFVANLAYRVAGVENEAKVAILVASIVAGLLGYMWLRFVGSGGKRLVQTGGPRTVDPGPYSTVPNRRLQPWPTIAELSWSARR